MSVAGRVAREAFSVIWAAAVGMIFWLTAMVAGIKSNVIGVVFYDPADYPYADTWVIASVVLAVGLAGSTWWLATRRRSPRPRPPSTPPQQL